MAKINEFFDWLPNMFADLDGFTAEAERLHADVCKSTNGWASPGKIHVLHNALLCMDPDEQYLEIGTYTGRSLSGALRNNDKLAQVIDPFELALPDGHVIYQLWLAVIQQHGVFDRVTLHKTLCEHFNGTLPPIGVLYLDGNHDSGHTYEALVRFEKYLSDSAIIIVDDYSLHGGHQQKPFPGHALVIDKPVQIDVDRWVNENSHATVFCMLPWENVSAVICYERN